MPLIPLCRARAAVAVLGALLAGCAGLQSYREGQSALAEGRVEPAIQKLKEALDKDPENVEYRRAYFAEREQALNRMMRQADLAINTGNFEAARQSYQQALRIDPGNDRATDGLNRVDVAQRHWAALDTAVALGRGGDVDGAIGRTQQVLSENPNHVRAAQLLRQLMRQQADRSGKELGLYPRLKAAYRTPVSLSFNNAPLTQVFDALKAASGLNYVLDKDVRQDLRVTLSVKDKPVEDILRLLLATNQLERRVLDEDTLLVYPNTPAKAAEYREMVVRTFYLANAEAAKMAGMVRSIAKARDVVVDEKLNLLVVRDSAEVIRLVEKLIATQDVAEPEVMLELEVLEVSMNRLLEMGVTWPSSVAASVAGAEGVAGELTLKEFRNRSSDLVTLQFSDPFVAAQLRSQKGSANLLANPRVRVRNKQSAKILIGERVPVFTTTATANVGTSESVSYLDVGLKLEIEPTVSLDDEVSMKLALEVSNILETIRRTSGTQAYRLGTRNTSTTLRVRDGETNVLAGLIQRDERKSNTGVPGLNEVPVISKLFGGAQDSDTRTEIILLVTPRIVRNVELPGVGLQEFLSGTDASVGASPIQLGTPVPGARPASPPLPVPPQMPSPMQVPPAPINPLQLLPTIPPQPLPTSPLVPNVPNVPGTNPANPPVPPAFTPPPLVPTSPPR